MCLRFSRSLASCVSCPWLVGLWCDDNAGTVEELPFYACVSSHVVLDLRVVDFLQSCGEG